MKKFNVSASGSGQAQLMISKGGARKGAGRKRIGETRQISLTLKDAYWAMVDELIAEKGMSQSEAIRHIIERK